MSSFWPSLKKIIRDDSMSIALFSLFLICIASQSLSGWFAYNQALQEDHRAKMAYGVYLSTGNFLDGMFSNWQAAVLQLAVLIAFGSVLRQKGAAHSRKSANSEKPKNHRTLNWKLGPRSTVKEWLYANSLSLAFISIFLATFILHAVFGNMKYNEEQAFRHRSPVSFGSYIISPGFWFSVLQTWEAEFFVIGLYIVLSIFLRQEASSESKPVDADDEQTGEVNE